MRPVYHLAVSSGLALLQWRLTGSRRGALWTLASGVLIDLDHLPDYLLNVRREELRLTLLFHSWELWVLVALLAAWRAGPLGAVTLGGSPVVHLWLDVWGNRVPARFFFLSWRWRHGFRLGQAVGVRERRTFPRSVQALPGYVLRSLVGPPRRPPRGGEEFGHSA
ncbi:MAG: hypothetical protein KatS3mg061_3101 [Dehalococcoidia bacterium]|nr:MAG: hypothetical protein KatS3mg061_3101 [Dehalococcoidia bacterium]